MNSSCFPSSHVARHLVGILLAGLLSSTAATAAPDQLPVEGKTVELPAFTVTDSRALPEPEPWRHTRVGRFEVLSSAGERATRRLLADFQRFQQAMNLVWPVPAQPLASTTLIVCGKDSQFTDFLPAEARAGEAIVPSRHLRDRESLALVVNLASARSAISDAATLVNSDALLVEVEFDHATLLYREYLFSLLNQSELRPPAWMAEGLAQIVMDAQLSDRTLIYGKVDTFKGAPTGGQISSAEDTDASANVTAVVGEQPFNYVLQRRRLIPLGDFLAIPADSPEARAPLGNTLWAKQAYLFVHFCLFGEDLRHRDHLTTFVQRLTREPLSEQLFRDCFTVGYREMEEQLYAYLRHVRHKYQRYELKPEDKVDARAIAFTDATPAQIGLILGDALRLAGDNERAHEAYRTAYLRGARDPALLAGLAQTEEAAGHAERAAKFLDAACAADAPRPSAHARQARLRLEAALARPAAEGKLDPAQLGAVLQAVFNARKHRPLVPETYHVAAAAWAASSVKPKPANLAVLDEGVRAFPRDSALLLATARLYADAGVPDTAAAIARLGARFARDQGVAEEFERLINR